MRLSHSLALVFALFGALITGGLVARNVRVARRDAYARTERLGAVTLEAVRALVQVQARQGRFIELGRNLGGLVRLADVATVVVRDGRGRRLVARPTTCLCWRAARISGAVRPRAWTVSTTSRRRWTWARAGAGSWRWAFAPRPWRRACARSRPKACRRA